MMEAFHPLVRPIIIPLLAGLVLWCLGRRAVWASRLIALMTAILCFGLCAAIWNEGTMNWQPIKPWLSLYQVELQFAFKATAFSSFLTLATSVFTFLIVLLFFWLWRQDPQSGKVLCVSALDSRCGDRCFLCQ